MREKMWYLSPASGWINGFLIGTGRISGAIFGNGSGERIGLNHEKLYSAKYKDRDFLPESFQNIMEIRRLLKQGKYSEATSLSLGRVPDNGDGIRQRTDDFKPAGELVIVPDSIENHNYRRALDLDTATAEVEYDGVSYEYAADSVNDRIFVHIKGALSARMDLEFRESGDLRYRLLRSPRSVRAIGEYAVGSFFETRADVYTDGSFDGSRLTVCKEALIVIDIEAGLDGEEAVSSRLDARTFIPEGSYESIIRAHIEKYRAVMNRTVLELEDAKPSSLPTDERLRRLKAGESDPGLIKMYFDFGHYLMYSGTVCGETPMNLQGKWNHFPSPPWHCDYHNDINLQMNYWPAEGLGMGEVHLSLMSYIERMVPQARRAAKIRYGCRGVFIGLTDDHWARATMEPRCCSVWPGAAAWYGEHFFRHYEYTLDESFLRERAYPYMKEVCEFFEDYLEADENGVLQVIPSQSPENHFMLTYNEQNGGNPSAAISSAMDLSLIQEILENSINAARILKTDPDKIALWTEMLKKLQPLSIGSDGKLLEWKEEFEEGTDPGHRHLSHLYGVYPGGFINDTDTPELMKAAKKSYDYRLSRGSGYPGWSRAWNINLDARFGRPDHAYEQLHKLISTISSDTFLNMHPSWNIVAEPFIFQIDGNFGGICGILEMLAGVSRDRVALAPALPKQFGNGSIRGLHLPGKAQCDLFWKEGALESAEITLGPSGTILPAGKYALRSPDASAEYENGCTSVAGKPFVKITLVPAE